ncbi:MAG TPA: choice-of-anchor D domain-containing protein, partial [Prosthecobacter sp.]
SLVGTTANDQISSGGISFVGTDYVVVRSPLWDNGDVANVGAVSVKSITPFSGGSVSATNAIVGSTANDQVGSGGITVVGTEVVLVRSPLWDNGGIVNAGAVTRVIPVSSTSRTVSTTNSIVGGSANDQVGSGGITVLGTTAYLIRSPLWDHSVAADAGAVTFDTVSVYSSGAVSRSNSLVGSHANDQIGSGGITTAGGGATFTISSPNWCYGAGASTAGNSTDGVLGVVSSSNSTVGAESAVPEIAVLQPAPTEVANNGTRDFGDVAVGSTQGLSFVIKNTGTDDLYLTGSTRVARSGTDAGLFSVVAQPTNLIVAGDSVSFTLNFTPTSEGDKTAQISISNTDSNESPYRVNLTGSGLSAMGGWRKTHFGSSANTGSAADAADFDNDGIPNLVEYALGLHPAQSTTAAGQLPVPASDGGGNFGLSFTAPAGLSGVTYGAEWSPSLVGGSWLPVTDTGTPPQHVFSVPTAGNAQIFLRLKILAVP